MEVNSGNFICENIAIKAIFFFFSYSEMNSTWLITSELANQRARKVLFTRIQIFLNPQSFFFLETASVHTHPANPDIYPLSREENNKSATNPITCGRGNFLIRKEKVEDLKIPG